MILILRRKFLRNFILLFLKINFIQYASRTNKGFGIKQLSKYCKLGLDEIVIIGNDLNNIDMFK